MTEHDRHPRQDQDKNWFEQAKDWMKEQWDWLTDDDYRRVEERPDELEVVLRDHYGDEGWEDEYKRFNQQYPDLHPDLKKEDKDRTLF